MLGVPEVSFGLVAHGQGLLFRHDEHCRGTVRLEQHTHTSRMEDIHSSIQQACVCVCVCVYQEGGVCCRDGSVRFDEGSFQFGHLGHGGRTDAVVLGYDVPACGAKGRGVLPRKRRPSSLTRRVDVDQGRSESVCVCVCVPGTLKEITSLSRPWSCAFLARV